MMKPQVLDMRRTGNHLSVYVRIWNKTHSIYDIGALVFDTGASVTTISKEVLHDLGYDVTSGKSHVITTASASEIVKEVTLERIRLAEYEFENVIVYAHTFPQESYTTGVIGLDILSQFDINILFSKRLIEFTKINA